MTRERFESFTNHQSVVARWLLGTLCIFSVMTNGRSQTTPSADTKVALKTALVLTPEFCSTKIKKRIYNQNQTLEAGKDGCAELEPALSGVFSSLTRLSAEPAPGEAQLVLIPRVVDARPTSPTALSGHLEMIVVLEWTAKDSSGRTVWIDSVQGSGMVRQHVGFNTLPAALKRGLEESMKDAAALSAARMSSSPELRKLVQ